MRVFAVCSVVAILIVIGYLVISNFVSKPAKPVAQRTSPAHPALSTQAPPPTAPPNPAAQAAPPVVPCRIHKRYPACSSRLNRNLSLRRPTRMRFRKLVPSRQRKVTIARSRARCRRSSSWRTVTAAKANTSVLLPHTSRCWPANQVTGRPDGAAECADCGEILHPIGQDSGDAACRICENKPRFRFRGRADVFSSGGPQTSGT